MPEQDGADVVEMLLFVRESVESGGLSQDAGHCPVGGVASAFVVAVFGE